ncbi:molybdate ABC transporter substrate-binding protein [Cellulomonas composti]|uniref:Molybdate-binding protein n=1 Tax=Cellulomonas composti TaxID=266130 RepID=A0A511JB71_9CELL|nr:molybdate ABC transporter substrate-binding protein [Cellulomonas composti]GEL95241.1 molybdate-binding protein [Cellulomonas composti]
MRLTPRAAAVALATVLLAVPGLAACGSSDEPGTGTSTTPTATQEASPTADDLTGDLRIFAAASLEPVFDELAAAFVAEHPGVTVDPITYDGSSTLATQLVEGATADVLATADEKNMQTVVDAGLVSGEPQVFTTNTLQIVVPAGNPKNISSLADLAALTADGGKVVLCAPEVPCGSASQKVLDAAGVSFTPASYEQNVTAVLTKVAGDEADAGLVYRTDVLKADDDVDGIDFPEAAEVVNRYPIATLTSATSTDVAEAFIAFVLSADGQELLAARGFVAPGA